MLKYRIVYIMHMYTIVQLERFGINSMLHKPFVGGGEHASISD